MLAIAFSLSTFYQYTFGRQTKVITFHKSLQTIVNKPLDQAPRRPLLKTQQYDIIFEYQSGKETHIAYVLFRAHLPNNDVGDVFDNVNMVSYPPIRMEGLDKIRRDTKDDDVMCTLIETILSGWPAMKAHVPNQLASYFHTDTQYKMD